MSKIGERLREERKRLGMSQEAFGALAGVKTNAQFNYEAGNRSPDSDYLSALAKHGVDVLYVLTGRRTPGLGLVHEIRRRFGPVIEMGEVGAELERLMQAEAAGGATRDRNDFDRLARAFATVNEGLVGLPPMSPARRAELILAAYDLLEEGDASAKERVLRLVKTS